MVDRDIICRPRMRTRLSRRAGGRALTILYDALRIQPNTSDNVFLTSYKLFLQLYRRNETYFRRVKIYGSVNCKMVFPNAKAWIPNR